MPRFIGRSYIEKPPLGSDINSINIIFFSNKPDGILFYNRGSDINKFVGAKIEKGFLHFVISSSQHFEIIV